MSKNISQKQVWRSGDWKNIPNDIAPYNGIEISCLSNYDATEKLISVEVCFSDFTYNPKGVSSIIPTLALVNCKTEIPKPNISSKDKTTSDFSIRGKVTLEKIMSDIYLRIHFTYGLQAYRIEEIGFLFKV